MLRLRSLLAFCLSMSTASALAATLNVGPGQSYTTIQSAINAASPGDTVLVSPGTYFENINFKGKAITVISTSGASGGAANTIIDGGGNGPAVTFAAGETQFAILSNLTIRNGGKFAPAASPSQSIGGIYITNSSPTIQNNVITQNNCWGIESVEAAPAIFANEISATQDPNGLCSFGGGAGIYLGGNLNGTLGPNNSPLVIGNTIENNVQSGNEDAGGNGGAGIAVWSGSPVIEGNIIRNNKSPGGSGGAIHFEFAQGAVVMQNLIYGNQAGCGGGALSFEGNPDPATGLSFVFANNAIVNNTDYNAGNQNVCSPAPIAQIYPGPDSYGFSNPTVIFVNNIISGSSAHPAINCYVNAAPSEETQPIFDHNILYNAGQPFFGPSCVDVSAKYGNISADPQLVNIAAGNFQVESTSPAIDAGNNSVLQSFTQLTGFGLVSDFGGNPRQQDVTGQGYPIIDIGPYEYSGLANASPTAIVLTSSPYNGIGGANFTLTATATSALGIPTGSISFFLDSKPIGTSAIGSKGQATLSNFLISPGVHSLYATYPGQGSFTPAISVIIIDSASGFSTSLTLTSSVNPSQLGQSVTFTTTAASADPTSIPSPIVLTDTSTNTVLATLTPNSSGVATFTTSSLTAGNHNLVATYTGDATHASAQASLTQQVATGSLITTTTTWLVAPSTLSLNAIGSFSTRTLVASGTFVSGKMVITDGNTVIAATATDSTTNNFLFSFSTVGPHVLTASFVPSGNLAPSSATTTVNVVAGVQTNPTIVLSPPGPLLYGTDVTGTLFLPTVGANPPATGRMTLYIYGVQGNFNSMFQGPQSLLRFTGLNVGVHTFTCSYGGDAVYNPANCNTASIQIVAAPSTLTISSSSNPAIADTPLTLVFAVQASTGYSGPIGGPISFTLGSGSPISVNAGQNGAAAYTFPAGLPPGTYPITATYAGNNNLAPSTGKLTLVVTAIPTTTTLSASPNPAYQNQPVTITAAVTSSTGAPSAGSVSFLDAGTVIGVVPVNASGLATLTTTTLALGTHGLLAVFVPDPNGYFLASTSNSVTEVIALNTFSLALLPGTLTLPPGKPGTAAIQLSSIGIFAGPLTLSFGTLPQYATGTLSTSSVTLTPGGSASSTFSLQTVTLATNTTPLRPGSRSETITLCALFLLLPLALRRRTRLRRLLMLCAAAILFQSLTGCVNIYEALHLVAPGTYQIPFTATDSNNNTQTQNLTLVVQ